MSKLYIILSYDGRVVHTYTYLQLTVKIRENLHGITFTARCNKQHDAYRS